MKTWKQFQNILKIHSPGKQQQKSSYKNHFQSFKYILHMTFFFFFFLIAITISFLPSKRKEGKLLGPLFLGKLSLSGRYKGDSAPSSITTCLLLLNRLLNTHQPADINTINPSLAFQKRWNTGSRKEFSLSASGHFYVSIFWIFFR